MGPGKVMTGLLSEVSSEPSTMPSLQEKFRKYLSNESIECVNEWIDEVDGRHGAGISAVDRRGTAHL